MARRNSPSVVFISHDAGRTGAPIALLRLLRWFKAHAAFDFEVVLRDGSGPLRADFEALAPVTVWDGSPVVDHGRTRWWGRLGRSAGAPGSFDSVRVADGASVIYSNTITNGAVIAALARPLRTVITHVHELGHWIDNRVDAGGLEQTLRHTSRYVAASRAVETRLRQMGIGASRIDVVYESVDMKERPAADARATVRRRHDIPAEAFVVGGIGTTDWRKGPDIFVQVAAALSRLRPQIRPHFVWVGGHDIGLADAELRYDVSRAGLEGRVQFVAAQPNPLDYLDAFDVLALTSREDPFPLVCLEAASVGKPVVCFEGAGGAPEFVEADAGRVVPYLDVDAFARTLAAFAVDTAMATRLGSRARQKVQTYDVGVIGPQIAAIIASAAGKA